MTIEINDLIQAANGRAKERTLDPVATEREAIAAYALGVSWCEALGLPYSSIRVEITGGRALANGYSYRADCTCLRYDGAAWTARRVQNFTALARGTTYLVLPYSEEPKEVKAQKAAISAAGLRSRKEGLSLVIYK